MPNLNNFPSYFRAYSWADKHSLYGYPADSFPNFEWISALERRFCWLVNNCGTQHTTSIYLVQEMIQWGGSQNGFLQKFDDGRGEINLYHLIHSTVRNLADPKEAISSALQIPGMGLTYASKMLRFFDPEKYGALDSRLRRALREREPEILPQIWDANINSMVRGYVAFTEYLATLKSRLETSEIVRPSCALSAGNSSTGWRAADIEMALFQWSASNEP